MKEKRTTFERLTPIEKLRTTFMNKVQLETWTALNDRGIDYNFEEINAHFREMLQDEVIVSLIAEYFIKRFTDEKQVGPATSFPVWYKEVKRLVEENESFEFPNHDLPCGILRGWWQEGITPSSAAHIIDHEGIKGF